MAETAEWRREVVHNKICNKNMCSNNCNSACVCGASGNVVSSIWSSSLKKQQKRPRVPKRGPGVAELEKILREQETIDLTDNENPEGFSSFVSHHSNSNSYSSSLKFHPPQPPTLPKETVPSSSFSTNVPSAPIFDHSGPTTLPNITSVYGSCGSLDRNGGSRGSRLVSPEKDLFPLNLNSCRPKLNMNEPIDVNRYDSTSSPSKHLSNNESNSTWPYSVTIQKRNNHYSSSTANQLHGTTNSSGSLSIGLHNHPELPSNQSSYYNYMSRVPEEHQMVGMKRSHSSSTLENSLIPPSNFHVLPSFSHYNRPHQSSSINDGHGVSSFNSSKECYRDAKWGTTLELSNTRFNSDMAVTGHANFPPFVTSEVVPSPPMHLFPGVLPKGNVPPSQVNEDKMDSYKHSESSESNCKSFYNFLEVEDSGVSETMRNRGGGRETRRVGIDLNLKL